MCLLASSRLAKGAPALFPAPYRFCPQGFFLSLLLLSTAALPALAQPIPSPDDSQSIVAIADVHGDFDDFVAILRHTGLTDQQNHWIAGKTTFVQVGDLLDRGPKPRAVMDLMMALEKEASSAGGRVLSLLGNHEMMNIMGDLRYVTPANYASFADSNSEQRQKSAYREYVQWRDSHAALIPELPQPMELTEGEWMARHPAGFIEQREAFSPKGTYGKWLREHAAIAEIDGNIFLHGGISPAVANIKIEALNKQIRDEIKAFDDATGFLQHDKILLPFFTLQEINNVLQAQVIAERKSRMPASEERQNKIIEFLKQSEWLSVRVDGPLWFRGYDQWSDSDGAPQAAKILEAYNAKHIIVGHTVQKSGRIRPRFDNQIFLIDTGMLSSYYPGGRASALEICAGGAQFIGVYLDQQTPLLGSATTPAQSGSALKPATVSDTAAQTQKPPAAPANRICSAPSTTPQ
jgi:hypothetical protein